MVRGRARRYLPLTLHPTPGAVQAGPESATILGMTGLAGFGIILLIIALLSLPVVRGLLLTVLMVLGGIAAIVGLNLWLRPLIH